jgi:1-acyl-sn-glycerol-3-phosphate acyltransferase
VIACNHVLHTDFRFHLKAITHHSLRFLGLRDSTPWESINALISLLFRLTAGFVDRVAENFVVFIEKGRPMPPSSVTRLLGFLKRKHYLIIMSEGRVTREETQHIFYRGIGWFALKADCPIVPIAVSVLRRGPLDLEGAGPLLTRRLSQVLLKRRLQLPVQRPVILLRQARQAFAA